MPLFPGLVQSVSNTGTTSPLSLTLPNNTQPGNTLIVNIGSSATPTNPTISSITLGGSAGNFAQVVTAGTPSSADESVFMWNDPNCAAGQTALSVTFSGTFTGSVLATAMEFAGILQASPADKSTGQNNDAAPSTWSSTATATTTQPAELAVGCCLGFLSSGIGTIGGPSSPWVNLTQETSSSTHVGLLSGYQLLNGLQAVTYSGTFATTGNYSAVVATFKLSPYPPALFSRQAAKRASFY